MMPTLVYVRGTYQSPCSRCGASVFTTTSGFLHDVRCWGLWTALHNLSILLGATLGLWGIAATEDDR